MITKRIGITYAFLFLFAFTFALSFTLASKAQAEPECCFIEICYFYNPPVPTVIGHWELVSYPYPHYECLYTGQHQCDFMMMCPEGE